MMTDGSNVFFPWLLNTTPNAASLNQPASRGVDNLNNVEQIAIDNPTIELHLTVSGSTIPLGMHNTGLHGNISMIRQW